MAIFHGVRHDQTFAVKPFETIHLEVGPGKAMARTAPATAGVKPDFFIVGAPKCGTSALSDYLAAHPDVFMAQKEMHFFGGDLRFAPHFYRRARREYLAEFRGWNGQRRVGEASVWYLFSETAAAEIKAFNPQARIIVMLREPLGMMGSLFQHFSHDGNESLATFSEALDAETDRRAGRRVARQAYFPQGLAYREAARFTRQVERYFEVFGRDRVRVILQEDLAANPAAVYRDTLRFLEVDATHTLPEFSRVNPAQRAKNRTLQALLNEPILRSGMVTLRPWLPQTVFRVCQRLEGALRRRNMLVVGPVSLGAELKARLRCEFAPEVERLGRLIGRDLSHWSLEIPPIQNPPRATPVVQAR